MENQTTLKKFRWFWAWQDEKEEAWLEEMSAQGWHLVSASIPGNYLFEKGEPHDFVYRLDFQYQSNQDREAYLQLFQDAGWELVGQMNTWYYFRKLRQPGETPEIFTDRESKIAKYQRVLGIMIIFFPIWIVLFTRIPIERYGFFSMLLGLLYLVLMLLFSYAVLNLIRRISQLKRP